MSYEPEKIYHALMESGNDYADKRAAFCVLDDLTKSVLADAYTEFKEGSAAEKKEKALASDTYLAHLQSLSVARRAFLLAQVRYKSTEALADAQRTKQSTMRAEMKHISGQV